MGLRGEELEAVAYGALLHDVGKIGVPEHLLRKEGPLSDDEWSLMRRHPEIGERICQPLRASLAFAPIIRHHHERFNGGGYPDGLRGEQIPLGARIVAIADAYEAMVHGRPYQPAQAHEQAPRRAAVGCAASSSIRTSCRSSLTSSSATRRACRRWWRCPRLRSLSGKPSPAPESARRPERPGWKPEPPGILKRSFMRYGIRFFVGTYLRVRHEGFETLPDPPYLLSFSHPSWVDPFLLASHWPREHTALHLRAEGRGHEHRLRATR